MRRVASSLLIASLIAVGLTSGSTSASPSPRRLSVAPRSALSAAAIRDYWTAKRMARATSRDLVLRDGTAQPLDLLDSSLRSSGTPVAIPGGRPTDPLDRSDVPIPRTLARNATDGEWTAAATSGVSDPGTYPFVTHGKLFAHDPEIGDYVCSATVVPSQGRNLVWTAGHCLGNEGVWADLVLFVPGYDNGFAPFGEWVAEIWGTSTQWAQFNTPEYDFGVMIMKPNNGVELADAVGWRGIIFNQADNQFFSSFGYPAAPPFDGETMWTCDSQWVGNDPYSEDSTNPPMGMECDMTQGSSGGGWIIGEGIENSFLNSNVSYSRGVFPGVQFGPYLGTVAEQFWKDADSRTASVTPTPFPTPTDFVDTHDMVLSLSLSKHLIASGRMTAPDGYLACTRGAPVGIFRKAAGTWKLLKVMLTNDNGTYRFSVRDRTGRYLAYGIDGYVDDLNYCTETISAVKVHRH